MDEFSVRLKKLRRKNGLSQKVLANKLGIGQTSIANYEANKRVPSLEIFVAIADVFNVSLDYLAGTVSRIKNDTTIDEIEMISEGEYYLELLRDSKKSDSFNYIVKLKNNGWQNIDLYKKIFVPVLRKTGDLWENGSISIGEEHYISNAVLEIISHMYTVKSNNNKLKGKILMTTVNQEKHIIGLKIMENILTEKGYETYFIGNNISSKHILHLIELQKPRIIILSITMKSLLDNLGKGISMIRRNSSVQNIKIIVVGQGIENRSNMVYAFGADAYGDSFEDVLGIIEKWTIE